MPRVAIWVRVSSMGWVALGVMVFMGCTVTPRVIKAREISFDGNAQNSGLIAFAPDGSGIITSNAWVRYNALILRYGTNFAPSLATNAGVTVTSSNAFLLDAEHLIKFGTMNHWRRNNLR